VLSPWNVLLDLTLGTAPDTLCAFDSTFTITMVSGRLLRDRVTFLAESHYVGFDQLPAFGSPIVNCFVYARDLRYEETVDTAGVLLFQGPVVALTDTVWYADGIGPIMISTRGNPLGVDSLGLPFSLAALRVVHSPGTHRTLEVTYDRPGGADALSLRYGLYDRLLPVHTLMTATARSY